MSPDGGTLYVAGRTGDEVDHHEYSYAPDPSSDFLILARNTTKGNPVWILERDGPGGLYDTFQSLEISPDGTTLYATGFAHREVEDSHFEAVTFALDAATGDILWRSGIDTPGRYDWTYESDLSENGDRLAVGGIREAPDGLAQWLIVVLNTTTGEQVWETVLRDPDGATLHDLAISPDGDRVYATEGTVGDVRTIAYDVPTDQPRWTAPGEGGRDIAVAPDGDSLLVPGNGGGVFLLNATTGVEESKVPSPPIGVTWHDLALTPDGSTIYTAGIGFRAPQNGQANFLVQRADATTSQREWMAEYDGNVTGDDIAFTVQPNPADPQEVYAGGFSLVTGDADILVTGIDAATGTFDWISRYNGPADGGDLHWSNDLLQVHPTGESVYVAGRSAAPEPHDGEIDPGQDFDLVTLRYETPPQPRSLSAELEHRSNPPPPEAQCTRLEGDADCANLAVSGTGDASCWGLPCAAASLTGNASGIVAASATGDANGCTVFVECVGASATGDATGINAASGTGNATSCWGFLNCFAVAGTGDAHGGTAVSGTEDASGSHVAVSGTGNASGDIAVSLTGEAEGNTTVNGGHLLFDPTARGMEAWVP